MRIDYSEISGTYDEYRSFSKSLAEMVAEFGGIQNGMMVLDAGCGTGNLAARLFDLMNLDKIGADISIPMLKVARGKSLEVVFTNMANNSLPFRDDSFDIVLATYVIHQVSNLGLMFSECHRVLRDGTIVLLTSSHEQIENQHLVFKQFFPGAIAFDKARFPDIPVVCDLLVNAGFRDTKHKPVSGEAVPIDEAYLRKIKGKYISTYCLLPQEEFERGVAEIETYIKNRDQIDFSTWHGTLICGRKRS